MTMRIFNRKSATPTTPPTTPPEYEYRGKVQWYDPSNPYDTVPWLAVVERRKCGSPYEDEWETWANGGKKWVPTCEDGIKLAQSLVDKCSANQILKQYSQDTITYVYPTVEAV